MSPAGEPVDPPESHALISGVVVDAARQHNAVTGEPFWWALVDTLGGTFDVVINPELLDTPIEPGNVLSGWFWLSGRLRTGQPTKSGSIKNSCPIGELASW
ncbi:MAG: hypothetical protein QM736_08915 [Vicinamibacterales bacterium]